LHEKKIERTIQTIKAKVRSIRAHLPYILPKQLDAEIHLAAVSFFNITPTKNTGTQTPFQLFYGAKPKIPLHPFGTSEWATSNALQILICAVKCVSFWDTVKTYAMFAYIFRLQHGFIRLVSLWRYRINVRSRLGNYCQIRTWLSLRLFL
jgi:hypothetical protein